MSLQPTEVSRSYPTRRSVVAAAAACAAGFLGPAFAQDGGGPKVEDRLMGDPFSKARPAGATVDMVVLHFSSDVIAQPGDPYQVDRIVKIYEAATASAHYLVGRGGTVYRLVKEDRQAFHAGKGKLPWEPTREDALNATSIGIELMGIGSKADMVKMKVMTAAGYDAYAKTHPGNIGFTAAQYDALKALLADIAKRRPAVTMDRKHVVGHDEYAPDRRSDPGELFDWSGVGLPAKP